MMAAQSMRTGPIVQQSTPFLLLASGPLPHQFRLASVCHSVDPSVSLVDTETVACLDL